MFTETVFDTWKLNKYKKNVGLHKKVYTFLGNNVIVLENTQFEFPGFFINVPRIFYCPFFCQSVMSVPSVRQSASSSVRQRPNGLFQMSF